MSWDSQQLLRILSTTLLPELLVTEMKLVGATQQALGEFYSQAIDFPLQSIST